MEDDQEKQEEKIDIFTREGESLGYISLDQARVLAIRHARDNPEFYGSRYSGINFVWEVLSQEEGDDYYDIRLSFRPAGRFRGEPGIEQFTIDKLGNIEIRQLLDEPTGIDLPAEPESTETSQPQSSPTPPTIEIVAPPPQTAPSHAVQPSPTPSSSTAARGATPPGAPPSPATAAPPIQRATPTPQAEPVRNRSSRKKFVIGGLAAVGVVVLLFIIGVATDNAPGSGGEFEPAATVAPEVFATSAPDRPVDTQFPPTATTAPIAEPTAVPSVASSAPSGRIVAAISNFRGIAGTPQFCGSQCPETLYLMGITETLTGVEAGDSGPLEPRSTAMLAESWEFPPDLAYIRFNLRDGIQFHSGWGEVTAADVAFTYNNANAAINPDSVNPRRRLYAELIDEVRIVDDLTVDFVFNSFDPTVPLQYMSPFFQGTGIVSQNVFNDSGPEEMRNAIVGTGPFAIVAWEEGVSLTAGADFDHWRQAASVAEVTLFAIPDTPARIALLQTGEAQIATEIPPRDMADLQDQGFIVERGNGLAREESIFFSGNYWEEVNPFSGDLLDRPREELPWIGFFDDSESMRSAQLVRVALALAIDREAINNEILAGMGEVCFLNQVSVRQPGWQNRWDVPYDPESARELLGLAGYPGGFEIPLFVRSDGLPAELAEAVASMWRSELDVDAFLDFTPYAAFRPGLVNRSSTTPWISPGREGKSGIPIHWPKGRQGSAITDGQWGPGFEDPFYTDTFFNMSSEIDVGTRIFMAEDYFDHVQELMLQPCIVEVPVHPVYNPDVIARWEPFPNMDTALGGMNNFESIVLTR